MHELLDHICGERGVFLRHEAEALGYDDHAIARAVRQGDWIRVRRGAYTLAHRWSGLLPAARYGLRCRAVVRQARTPVALSHTSSLNAWGCPLWEADLSLVHITRLDGRAGRKEAGVCQHRGAVAPRDVVEVKGVLVTAPARAGLEYATLSDTEHAVVEIDDILHRGIGSMKGFRAAHTSMTHWPDTLMIDMILRLVDGRSESVGESRVRFLCWKHGLPAPVPNYPIRDRQGRIVARVDLAWPALGLYLEFDGKVKYEQLLKPGESASDVVVREKRREEMICSLTGWRCIRLAWADLYTPELTAARIRSMFRSHAA